MAMCMLIVPLIGLETPTLKVGTKTEPIGIAIVFMLFLFIFFYKPSWGATTWIWTAEIFSMNVRSQAVGKFTSPCCVTSLSFPTPKLWFWSRWLGNIAQVKFPLLYIKVNLRFW
jgi:hypothetical protein